MTEVKPLVVGKDVVVLIHYTLHDDQKVLLDSSEGSDPLVYLHGHGQLIKGLESKLSGKKVGDKFNAEIEPDQAYGAYEEGLRFSVPSKEFPTETKVEVGSVFEVSSAKGQSMLVRVVEMTADTVMVDANHPLAGKKLFFDVEVVGLREATATELEHGHVHGPDGHHHH